jgi:hypothetical protein
MRVKEISLETVLAVNLKIILIILTGKALKNHLFLKKERKSIYMKINELIDRQVLFLHYPVSKFNVLEGKIKELSPSKNFVKINNDWYLFENLRILEVFSDNDKPSLGFK